MKRLFAFLLLVLCLPAMATNVRFDYSNITNYPSQFITVELTPDAIETNASGGLNLLDPLYKLATDTNGTLVITNIIPNGYSVTNRGPFRITPFHITVPSTNVTVLAKDILTVALSSPSATSAYSMAAADGRFIQKSNYLDPTGSALILSNNVWQPLPLPSGGGGGGSGTVTGVTNIGAGASIINSSNNTVPIFKSFTNDNTATVTDNKTNLQFGVVTNLYDLAGTGLARATAATNGMGSTAIAAFHLTSDFDLAGSAAAQALAATNVLGTAAYSNAPAFAIARTNRTFYVDQFGSDVNDGSMTRPWATIEHAATNVSQGLLILSGVFNLTNNVYLARGVTWDGQLSCTVTNWSTNTDNAGVYTNPGALFNLSDNTVLRGMKIYAGYKGGNLFQYHAGLVGTNATNFIIEGNIMDGDSDCVCIFDMGTNYARGTIRNNFLTSLWDCVATGRGTNYIRIQDNTMISVGPNSEVGSTTLTECINVLPQSDGSRVEIIGNSLSSSNTTSYLVNVQDGTVNSRVDIVGNTGTNSGAVYIHAKNASATFHTQVYLGGNTGFGVPNLDAPGVNTALAWPVYTMPQDLLGLTVYSRSNSVVNANPIILTNGSISLGGSVNASNSFQLWSGSTQNFSEDASGNQTNAGTLSVGGATTLSSTLNVAGAGTLTNNGNLIAAAVITNAANTVSAIVIADANHKEIGLANGGANTVLHGTGPPTYGPVVNGDITTGTINSNKLDAATVAMFGTGGGGGGGSPTLFNPNQFATNGNGIYVQPLATFTNLMIQGIGNTNYANTTGITRTNQEDWFYTNGNIYFAVRMTNNTFVLTDSNLVSRVMVTNAGGVRIDGGLNIVFGTTNSDLTASTVPYSDANKKLTSSAVTPTELGYVSGVTSAIQTQLGAKAATSDVVASTNALAPPLAAFAPTNQFIGSASGGIGTNTTISTLTNAQIRYPAGTAWQVEDSANTGAFAVGAQGQRSILDTNGFVRLQVQPSIGGSVSIGSSNGTLALWVTGSGNLINTNSEYVIGTITNAVVGANAVVISGANSNLTGVSLAGDTTKYLNQAGVFTVPAGGSAITNNGNVFAMTNYNSTFTNGIMFGVLTNTPFVPAGSTNLPVNLTNSSVMMLPLNMTNDINLFTTNKAPLVTWGTYASVTMRLNANGTNRNVTVPAGWTHVRGVTPGGTVVLFSTNYATLTLNFWPIADSETNIDGDFIIR